jgi:hypothetical protein
VPPLENKNAVGHPVPSSKRLAEIQPPRRQGRQVESDKHKNLLFLGGGENSFHLAFGRNRGLIGRDSLATVDN